MIYQRVTLLRTIILTALISLFSTLASAETLSLKILSVHFPPYEFENAVDGLRGSDIEVVEAAFQQVGIKPVFEFLPWVRAVELVYAGEAFALLTCAKNKKRESHLYFTDVISSGTRGYFYRAEETNPGFNSLAELKNQKVTAVRGYATQMSLEEAGVEHIAARSDKIALNLLHGGRVDFFYGIKEADFFIAKQLDLSQHIRFHPIGEAREYKLCISQKWPGAKELLAKFNRGLAVIKSDGTYQAIQQKYR